MLGTLTVHGDLDAIVEIAHGIQKNYPNGIVAKTAPTRAMGWDVPSAKALLAELASNAHKAIEIVLNAGGFADHDVLRAEIGDSLRGSITGPITRHMEKLKKRGVLDAAAVKPLEADYNPNITGRQRTLGLFMEDSIVPIFRDALGL